MCMEITFLTGPWPIQRNIAGGTCNILSSHTVSKCVQTVSLERPADEKTRCELDLHGGCDAIVSWSACTQIVHSAFPGGAPKTRMLCLRGLPHCCWIQCLSWNRSGQGTYGGCVPVCLARLIIGSSACVSASHIHILRVSLSCLPDSPHVRNHLTGSPKSSSGPVWEDSLGDLACLGPLCHPRRYVGPPALSICTVGVPGILPRRPPGAADDACLCPRSYM